MKKYFLIAAISAALLLTACGNNSDNSAETSAAASAHILETTLNTVTEMTVPAFNPEWEETAVTSPDSAPNSDKIPLTTASVSPLETVEFVSETTEEDIVVFTTVTTEEIAEVTSPAYNPNEEESSSETVVEFVSETTAVETTEVSVEEIVSETSAEETEDIFFEATVIGVEEKAILVRMKGETFIGEDGIDVYIFGSYDVEKGDTVHIIFTEEVGIDDFYPPEIRAQFIVSLEKAEGAQDYDLPYDSGDYDVPDIELSENEYVAYITDVYENKNGGYSLIVEAYNVAGYYSPVPISLYSETEFAVGDWVKVEFAPETCFMETSPLQVAKQDILSIELIEYK